MPRAYSADLRDRVLTACERREGSREEIARRFRVAASTLYAWLGAARAEGRRGPKPHGGGRPPVGGEAAALVGLVAERNDATLAEYADLLAERTGPRRSPAAVCRALKALARRSAGRARKGTPGGRAGPGRCRRGTGGVARRAGRGCA